MNTAFIPVRVDTRGSVNLPAAIKTALNIGLGATVLVRQINGVVVMVPMNGEAEQAAQAERLHEWVGEQLGKPVPAAPIQASKTAVAESIKLQTMRERFDQRRQLLELELRVAEQKAKQKEGNDPTAKARAYAEQTTPSEEDPIDALRRSRAAEGDRQMAATLREAETALVEPSTLPQVPLE